MNIQFQCPSTGAYVRSDHDDGGVILGGKKLKVRGATESSGIVAGDGTGFLMEGSVLHYNRGQHSTMPDGTVFVGAGSFFAIEHGGKVVPLPIVPEPAMGPASTPFHEMKGFTDERASKVRPLHHFVLSPDKVSGNGIVSVPASVGWYKPRDSYDGLQRPLCGVVLAVPSHPVDEDGHPFKGRVPEVGDTVWFSTLAWSGGTVSNNPFERDGGLLTRWPGLMGVAEMHIGMTPSGEIYAIGDHGIAMEVEHVDTPLAGRVVVGAGKFVIGGDAWESVHGRIPEGSWVSFKSTQGVNGDNTIAPAPWGWCVKIASRNLTGVSSEMCHLPNHSRRLS